MQVKDPAALRRARERRGYSQRLLATICQCSQNTISLLETGGMRGCSEDLAKILAKRLDRDLEDLFEQHAGSRMPKRTTAARRTRHAERMTA